MAGLAAAFGSGAMTNSIAELEDADCIFIIGSNTNENHPVIAARIKRAARFKNCDLIVADPRRQDLVKFARLWLRQTPGTDIALINGMMQVIIQENLYDAAYVAERTENFEALKATVAKYTPEYVEKISGVPAASVVEAARMFARAKAGSIVYCMGITQHTVGTDNVKSLANLAMLCGNVGIYGGGVNPLRGQNNVQGACDMGGLPNVFSGYQPVTDAAARKKMEDAWGVEALPDWVGMTMTDMLPAICQGRHQGPVHHGRKPGPHRPGLRPCRQGHAATGSSGGAGYLFDRDGETGRCGVAGVLVRRKGRDLRQHRKAGGPGAPGYSAGGPVPARLEDHL